jgi:AGCS family alanine or glycine:cation symporter
MAKPTMKALRDYEQQTASGVTEYTFNPKALGIKGAEFWEKRYDKQQAEKANK